jgi:hypothetical protein
MSGDNGDGYVDMAREISGATSAVVLYSDGGVLSRFINTDQLFSSCRAGCGDTSRQ